MMNIFKQISIIDKTNTIFSETLDCYQDIQEHFFYDFDEYCDFILIEVTRNKKTYELY